MPKKHVRTLHDRLKIIEEVEKNPGEKRVDIAERLGLSASTLNSIFAKKNEIREQIQKCGNACKKRKTGRESTFAELETVLFTWYQQARASNIPIDGTILREKAKTIAAQLNVDNFSASNGWVSRFKDSHGLVFKKLAGESAEVCVKSTDAWLESLPSLLEGYEPRVVYSSDEMALFFNVLPDRTLAYKVESCHGGKHFKDRLTVLLCVNSDGSDKQVPIVIGKSPKPRCFKNVKKLPIKYHANSKAWMMTEIFCSFLHSLDAQMGVQNRQIILFVDNCAAHPKDTPFLRNVTVVRYPEKCTSTPQPLDLGIIHSLKAYCRKRLVQTSICLMESRKEVKKKINIFEAMHYIMAAWQQMNQQTIQNCFRKPGYKHQSDGNEMANDDEDDNDDFGQGWEELCRVQKYDFHSYVSVDRHVATSGVETVEELCEAYGSTRSVEEKNEEDENEQEMVPSFAETYEALEKVKAFFYAQSVSNADCENILSLKKSYFQLRQNSAKKQKTIYDFFLLKKVVSHINRFPAFIICFLHPLEKQ